MNIDLTQLLSQLPIAGAMIWFAYYIVGESKAERRSYLEDAKAEREAWASERKEMYEKIAESHVKLSESIDRNTRALETITR